MLLGPAVGPQSVGIAEISGSGDTLIRTTFALTSRPARSPSRPLSRQLRRRVVMKLRAAVLARDEPRAAVEG